MDEGKGIAELKIADCRLQIADYVGETLPLPRSPALRSWLAWWSPVRPGVLRSVKALGSRPAASVEDEPERRTDVICNLKSEVFNYVPSGASTIR
jgi:hypothetical protein